MIRPLFPLVLLGACAFLAVGCGGAEKLARSPSHGPSALPATYVGALRLEATGEPEAATKAYLDLVDAAVLATRAGPNRSAEETWALLALHASLDALATRSVPAFYDATARSALAFRSAQRDVIEKRLADSAKRAGDPFAQGAIARVLTALAEQRGDARAAEAWRTATGCAREATIVGPLAWAPITGLDDPDPLERADAAVPSATPLPGPFATRVDAVKATGRGCSIPLDATTPRTGVRDVVVDATIDRAQTIAVSLRAHGAARLRAGGKIVIERPYELGADDAARFALVDVTPGSLRLVARVGAADGGEIEIDAWDDRGRPLALRAPSAGRAASSRATASREVVYPTIDRERSMESLATLAAAALALGDARTAERALTPAVARADAPAELLLVYGRAVETATDLPKVQRAERARAAYERGLEAWPTSWEAILAHAKLEGGRRGQNEARIEEVRDLDTYRGKAGAHARPLLDAFEALALGRESLHDRARAALERAKTALGGTILYADIERAIVPRVGAERVAVECASSPQRSYDSLDCHHALFATGDRAGAARELERLRELRGGPSLYLAISLRDALAAGDGAAAARIFDQMLPGERTLSAAHAIGKSPAELLDLAPSAQDAPAALPGLLRTSGENPFASFEAVAERLVAEDRAKPILADAATAVLAHVERYEIQASGLVHYVLLDVRRVSGTTDVESNAAAYAPTLLGRDVQHVFRRRILKKDGRVLQPDRTPHASQSHAELSQLEQGDVVEAIYEGWGLPGETGHVGIDTPDLLPERTAVHDATIELRMPRDLKGSMWSHPLLGKPTDRIDGAARVLTWTVKDRPMRRLEDGTPKMDRAAGVSFSTASWADVGRAFRETLAALDERDPEIRAWALEATKGATTPRAKLDALVEASGKAIKEARAIALLDDQEGGHGDSSQLLTARTMLAEHEGSRTWLLARALREIGIRSDIVLSENEPFSADPSFPPHFGRFTHPLLVAHLGEGAAPSGDVWVDADVMGPPLPAGRISPELRGRQYISSDGKIAALPAVASGTETDEIDIRLTVDEKGNARGRLTILLRGRAAQELAEAMMRIVGFEREKALRGVALAWIPFANVDDITLSSSEGSWQVALRAEVSIGSYAQEEGGPANRTWVLPGLDPLHTVFPRPYVSTLGATYASRGGRQTAFAINDAVQYHVRRRVELPPGTTIVRAPGAFELKEGPLEVSRRLAVYGTTVEEDFRLGVATGTIHVEKYGLFASDALRADAAFLAGIRVKPARVEPKKP
jgi:hypothetical protein